MTEAAAADRCQGVLVGLAAGDRNGGPIRMAVRLAESLLDCGYFAPANILERYLHWWREGAFDTGPVSARALALVAAGVPAPEATAQVHREFGGKTAGCNPAHRSWPLSVLAAITDEDLACCAMAEARLTHHDPLAGVRYYLRRHIGLDEGEHGPMAVRLVMSLCGNDEARWQEAEEAAVTALEARRDLWDGVHARLKRLKDGPGR